MPAVRSTSLGKEFPPHRFQSEGPPGPPGDFIYIIPDAPKVCLGLWLVPPCVCVDQLLARAPPEAPTIGRLSIFTSGLLDPSERDQPGHLGTHLIVVMVIDCGRRARAMVLNRCGTSWLCYL